MRLVWALRSALFVLWLTVSVMPWATDMENGEKPLSRRWLGRPRAISRWPFARK